MSVDRALRIIDDLLEVLDEADKRASQTGQAQQPLTEATQQPLTVSETTHYFKSYEDVSEGQRVRVSGDIQKLEKEWNAAGMPENGTYVIYQ